MRKDLIRKSKFLSLVLRHHPETVGIELDEHGWAVIDELLQGAKKQGIHITAQELQEIVETNDKRRFSIQGGRVRANQGHSIPVKMDFIKAEPPRILYHGTAQRNRQSIMQQGILKQKRHHVHLSRTVRAAQKVGARHGKSLVLEIDAERMYRNNVDFFISENGIWLVEKVPPEYISVMS